MPRLVLTKRNAASGSEIGRKSESTKQTSAKNAWGLGRDKARPLFRSSPLIESLAQAKVLAETSPQPP